MAHFNKQQLVAQIRQVLGEHGALGSVQISQCEGFEYKVDVELGYAHIDNDRLVNDLFNILRNNTADVEISPCREVFFKGIKTYL